MAGFRAESGMGSFSVFDFTPVGVAITAAGLLFIVLIGWRLVPVRRRADVGTFDTAAYLTEVRIEEGSKVIDKPIREVEKMLEEADAQIVGMVHHDFRVYAPYPGRVLKKNEILVIEAEPEALSSVLSNLGLVLEENVPAESEDEANGEENKKEKENGNEKEKSISDEILIQELVVMPNGNIIGRSASDIRLRTRFGINLLAISRQGRRSIKRLRNTAIKAGDVLLMQGPQETLSGFASEFGCIPLAARDIRVPKKGQALIAALIMVLAVAVAGFGLIPVAVSFAAGVLAMMVLRIIPLRSVYQAIDWPVIVLLGAMLPVAGVMASTGAADLVARALLENIARENPVLALTVIFIVTMILTDFMNNAATAAVMCPIAISTSEQLGVNPDTFLMAVAVGASCSFLTPIGHQNNTLILGPGGFRFGDYWRFGLLLEIVLVLVGIPALLWVWPL